MEYRGEERITPLLLTQDMIRQLALEAGFRALNMGELVGELVRATIKNNLVRRVLDPRAERRDPVRQPTAAQRGKKKPRRPIAMPALTRALKLQEKAARVGFDWSEAEPILDKIEEEIGELREALRAADQTAIRDEFGDFMFALVNLGRHLKLDSEAALAGTNEKFRSRFHYVEKALAERKRTLDEASLEEMEALWQEAKGKG